MGQGRGLRNSDNVQVHVKYKLTMCVCVCVCEGAAEGGMVFIGELS